MTQMTPLEMSRAGIEAREAAMRGEAQKVPDALQAQFKEAADLALEFVSDCASPEHYGHALPAEVVRRAGRIHAMLRPRACPTGVGYQEPPPARCEACDSE